ncbi:MAG: SGNH/GDSL hydrolase family protein [Candidatus Phosphoribacter sp.]
MSRRRQLVHACHGVCCLLLIGCSVGGASDPTSPTASRPAELAVFGDSISMSALRTTPGGTDPQRVGPGWAERLGTLVPPGLRVDNLVRPGSWLSRDNPEGLIPSIVSQVPVGLDGLDMPRYLLVLGGRNDLTHVEQGQLQQAALEIDASATARGVVAAFVTILPVNDRNRDRAITEPHRTRFNSWVSRTFGARVVAADPVLDRDGDGQLDQAFDAGDGVHLNEEGSQQLAAAAAAVVARNGWPAG